MDDVKENIQDEWSDDETSEEDIGSDSCSEEDYEDVSSDGKEYYYSFPATNSTHSQSISAHLAEESRFLSSEWEQDGECNPILEGVDQCPAKFVIPAINESSTVFDTFTYFISTEEVEEICSQSWSYVQQTQLNNPESFKNFKPFTTAEFYRFLALELLMGLVQKPTIKDYWTTSSISETPFFGKTMSHNRFEEILRSLHFCDNNVSDFKSNRMLKLGSLIPRLMTKFAEVIRPGRNLCVDESLTGFKGRLSFKQYMPKKRARFGVKLFVLSDCSTNFVINVIPYQGETTQLLYPPSKNDKLGYGGAVVHSLLNPYLDVKHIVFIDNWFNSPYLANLLTSKTTGVIGTVRRFRKGMPEFHTKLKKGDVETYSNQSLLVERWQDRREVLILSNCISHKMINVSKSQDKTRLKPQSALEYNKSMGSVDELDKILQPYVAQQKSLKWYKKLWFHYIDMVVYNARILFNSFKPLKDRVPYKKFLEILIMEIVQCNPIDRLPKGRPVNHSIIESRLGGRNHFPQKMYYMDHRGNLTDKPKRKPCYLCNLKNERHDGPYKCSGCGVHLCITKENSCFVDYHTQRHLPIKKCVKKALSDRSHYL